MAEPGLDLISMADIARMAGQSRATVGNWKLRNPESFPQERGRGSRGPLYDRAEVTAWLEATSRLDRRPPEVAAVWHLADQLRGGMTTEDAMPMLLLLLAVMSKSSPAEWRQLVHAAPHDLDASLRSAAHRLFPFADDVLPHGKLPAAAVATALATLSNLDGAKVSVMADALLDQASRAMGHRGGEFLTPQSVRRLVVAIAQPVGTVYNPASGVAQLMIDAATSGSPKPTHVVGQEINSRIWAMSQLNLAIHDVNADIALGDVFGEDQFPNLRADRVISVPPWNQRLPIVEGLMGDPRWVWGEPGPNDGNVAWIQHSLFHLAEGGRAVIVVSNSSLFEPGRAGRIRQRIVKAGLLDAVFSLPPGLFAWTSLPCSLLVFAKGRKNVGGKPAPTLMIDVSGSEEAGSRSTVLENDLIDEVAAMYHRWAGGEAVAAGYAAVATFDDLAANDFVIDPGRYLSLPEATHDLKLATRTRATLLDKLEALSRASAEADQRLASILHEGRR